MLFKDVPPVGTLYQLKEAPLDGLAVAVKEKLPDPQTEGEAGLTDTGL